MKLPAFLRRFIDRHICDPRPWAWTAATGDVRAADVVAQPVKRSRVTRTMFGRCEGNWLLRDRAEFGIRVRARCIPEAVEVIAANRGLAPREDQVA